MKLTHKCKCKTPAWIIIDSDNNNVLCGVIGIIDMYDVRIIDKKVICNQCKRVIYKEK